MTSLLPLLSVLAMQVGPATGPEAPASTAATKKLEVVRGLFAELDCEQVIVLAPAVEDHRLATLDERLEASFEHAYCLVLMGNLSEATGIFAAVVAEKVDANPPFEVEPRVQLLLEAARADELKRQAQAARAARQALIDQVKLTVRRPGPIIGGARAIFDVDIDDPVGLVRSARIEFRRVGEPDFYALPVVKRSDGSWRGEIPGTYTRSKSGLTLEWFVSVIDTDGVVVVGEGNTDAPEQLVVAPGSALALDLRANERLNHETRVVLALVATPMSAGVMALAAAVGANLVSALNLDVLTVASFSLLPAVGATVGTWLVASSILDGADITIAVATTAGFATIYAVAVVAAGTDNVDNVENSLDGNFRGLAILAAGAIAITGAVATGIVPTVLVTLDAPADE